MAKSSSRIDALPTNQPVAAKLQAVLQETYAAFLLTHNYHWNVEGPHFVSLHTLFEQQYTELFAAIDVIAERIRALGGYALDEDYGVIAKKISSVPNPLNDRKAKDKDSAARVMIENLLQLNRKVVSACQLAKQVAEKAGDDESVDLTVERITVHQKTIWMLESLLK